MDKIKMRSAWNYRDQIEETVLEVCNNINEDECFQRWQSMSEHELWAELVFCILSSRVSFELSLAATSKLDEEKLLTINKILKNPEKAEFYISNSLQNLTSNNITKKYPFFRRRANHIVRSAVNIYKESKITIKNLLENKYESVRVRNHLINICPGIGPKQSSFFLRNVQYAKNLAVVDRHLFAFLHLQGLINPDIVHIGNNYDILENAFVEYADRVEIPLHKLDYAIWLVMRVARRDFEWVW